MPNPIKTVAKVTSQLADLNDWTFQDSNGNYLVGMNMTQYLYPNEFEPMAKPPLISLQGMPTDPQNPIKHL